MSEEDIEDCLDILMITVTFVGRAWRCGTVEVRFSIKEVATAHETKILRIEKVTLLPTYKDKIIVRLRICRVTLEIKWQWVVAAMLSTTQENPEIVSVSKTNCYNWWGYGIEV